MPTIISALPYTLTNGTTGDASQVQADFDQIVANVNANAAANGANSDITSLTGLTTPLGRTYGGSQFYIGGTSTGTANAQVVATVVPNGFSLYAGVMVAFISGFNNSSTTTLNVGGSGVKNVFRQISSAAAACAGGEIVANQLVVVVYDGTQWQLINNALLPTQVLRTFAALSVSTGDIFYGSASNTVQRLAAGTNGHILTLAAGVPSWAANSIAATQTEVEAGSITTAWISPGTAKYSPGVAKAFVNFTSGASPTLNAAYNVSGVVRNATGDYTVTFPTGFSTANYVCVGLIYDTVVRSLLVQPYAQTTTTTSVAVFNTSTGALSSTFSNCQLTFFGDQA